MNDEIPDLFRADEQLVHQTIEQLKKDFGTFLPELVLSGNRKELFKELTGQVAQALQILSETRPHVIQSLLYKIDIKPGALTQSHEGLAAEIIRREFQKVLTRRYFSDHSSGH